VKESGKWEVESGKYATSDALVGRISVNNYQYKLNNMYNYDTVTEAISDLKARGFSLDFNLQTNALQCFNPDLNLEPEEFEIKEIYRFEGDSNPSDEEIVYAIESKDGHKGVFVNGYGMSADAAGAEMMKKLVDHHNQ
jgi:hypothetical protein